VGVTIWRTIKLASKLSNWPLQCPTHISSASTYLPPPAAYNMFSKLIALVAFVMALPAVSAEGCFGGQQGSCGSFIATFCSAEASPAFASHESRHQCYGTSSNYKCDLSVERTASGTGTYNYNDCFNAMTEMDTTCNGRGGIRTINGFQFILDPNLGSC